MEAASPVLYRPYRDADVDQVARVWLDSWRSTGISASNHVSEASNRERIIREIASGWRVTVAAHANSIVAFLAIKPTEKVLDQLFVTPSFQVIGIGLAQWCRSHPQLAIDSRAIACHGSSRFGSGTVSTGPSDNPRLVNALMVSLHCYVE